MFAIFALVWTPSVMMPACAPVSETAFLPRRVDGHGGEGDGGLLAGGEEHIHFPLGGLRRDFACQLDEVVGDAGHGGDDGHDLSCPPPAWR